MKQTTERLTALRKLLQNLPNNSDTLDAYIIPTDDCHQSEYPSPHDNRRVFISGFDGSAGTAVVTQNHSLLWTDGRYYEQAVLQLDSNWTLMKDNLTTTPDIGTWLNKNLPRGSRVGADPMLISYTFWNTILKELEKQENTLVPYEQNLIDLIWTEQPAKRCRNIINLDLKYAGRSSGSKLEGIRKEMKEKNADVLLLTALDEVAYFLNLRGSDIDYNPLFYAFVLITHNDVIFCVNQSKLDNINDHFIANNINVTYRKYDDVRAVLSELVNKHKDNFWISPHSSYALTLQIPLNKRLQKITPVCLMKAVKNDVEAKGMISCHIRDGVALCQYFAWLENKIVEKEHVDEISGAMKLEKFRSKLENFVGLSFPTITSSGPNGSIIHYLPSKESNRPITDQEIYLCDSGAQFLDGTTDVTRTMHFGVPTPFEKDCFTRVLKGQINLGTAIFPRKIQGRFLDTLARKSLWDVGLDYRHGTGHGVGHYLCVHEGPMGIGFRPMPDDPGLTENMFLSNEPGYYEEGKFGIRIEDIVQVVPAPIKSNFEGRGALTFNTVTMCPIQTKMINVKLLTSDERTHLNQYHQRVLCTLLPIIEKQSDTMTAEWLKKETKPI